MYAIANAIAYFTPSRAHRIGQPNVLHNGRLQNYNSLIKKYLKDQDSSLFGHSINGNEVRLMKHL
jgi:hypothetical protein